MSEPTPEAVEAAIRAIVASLPNELAEVIHSRICEESLSDCLEYRDRCVKAAESATAAGYRKPRTVTTVEELDALPVGAVVRVVHRDERFVLEKLSDGWYRPGVRIDYKPNKYWIGATVLYAPEPQS
jgi:hypothetical protein